MYSCFRYMLTNIHSHTNNIIMEIESVETSFHAAASSSTIIDDTGAAGSSPKLLSVKKVRNQHLNCGECAFKTTVKSYLALHIRRCHSLDKLYKCSRCTSAFVYKCDLKIHSSIHSGVKQMCHICGKSFKYGLKNHGITKHHESSKFQCVINGCNKHFIRKDCYQDHVNQHLQIRGHTCQICQKSFISKQMWCTHSERCHQKKAAAAAVLFKCDLCLKEFFNKV